MQNKQQIAKVLFTTMLTALIFAPLVGSLRWGVYFNEGKLTGGYFEKKPYRTTEEVTKLFDVLGKSQMGVDTSEMDTSQKEMKRLSRKAKKEVTKSPNVVAKPQMKVDTSEIDTSQTETMEPSSKTR